MRGHALQFGLLGLLLFSCGDGEAAKPQAGAGGSEAHAVEAKSSAKLREPSEKITPPSGADTPRPEAPTEPIAQNLRLNHIQAKGTHNAYHTGKPTLTEQYERFGVRSVEWDLHYDPAGIKVYHARKDPSTTCALFAQCLAESIAWSKNHPRHVPLVIFMEAKSGGWTAAQTEAVDEELRAVVPETMLLRPDDLTEGDTYPDVLSAVRDKGWPRLDAVRGKLIFVLHKFGAIPYQYSREGSSLRDRMMFVTDTKPGWRHAVILAMDYAIEQEGQIRDAVAQGYLVRTRSDGRVKDRQAGLNAALRSGAHFILTNYPKGLSGYSSDIPGGTPVGCNPVAFLEGCYPGAIEP